MCSWLLALTPTLTIWGVNQQSECSLAYSLVSASQIDKVFKKRILHFGAFCTLAFQIRDAHLVYVFVLHDFFFFHNIIKKWREALNGAGEAENVWGPPDGWGMGLGWARRTLTPGPVLSTAEASPQLDFLLHASFNTHHPQ